MTTIGTPHAPWRGLREPHGPTRQMLRNCLALVPLDAEFADRTLKVAGNLLGEQGAYALYDFPLRGQPQVPRRSDSALAPS